MSLATWALVIGVILITMAFLGTLLQRLPLSPGILYLAIGYALGPAGWALMAPDPLLHSADLERMAEIALLISLFAVGLKLGVPLRDKRWYLPLRLAFPSMVLAVVFVAVIGVFLLGLPAGAAILLVSVELDEIMSLSDRIAVMFDGKIMGFRDPDTTDERELGLLMAGVTGKGEAA